MITRVNTDFALYYLALSRSKVPTNPLQPTRIHRIHRIIHTVPVRIQREWFVYVSQPRVLLQEPPHRRVVPTHTHLLQPARQRLVAIAPRAVPVVGRTRACYRVAKRIRYRRRRIRTCRAAGRRQVTAQVPVLVFRARVAYLLVHRATVAVVYPLQRVTATLPTAFRLQHIARIEVHHLRAYSTGIISPR